MSLEFDVPYPRTVMTIARLARTAVFPLAALVVGVPVATAGAQAGDLQGYVTRELNGLQARSSIYAKHLASGKTVELRADVPMNTLSVIKIPVMILAFRDAEAGKLKLGERYTIRPEDLRRGSGLLQTFDVGLSPTYRDLIEQMIITSDNTATDIMIRTVGLARVNAMLAELGFRETRLNRTAGDLFREVWIRADAKHASMTDREVYDRGFPSDAESSRRSFTLEGDSTRWLGRTTAREMATMLEGILNAKYASKLSSEVMVGMLRRQFYASRLPQRIQFRASVAHKTGDWPPIAGNDVGIIFYPGGPSIVSVFTNQNTGDFFELESTLGRIAERVIDTWK
ncbi:MAG TPA: class A beta-lactamase-related serine hydrolase [Gemmatimonadaceae bacterium]|nr:class A beta-lactamase-related serine hydrolase [Gemmatimonadaceae bacterium]HPV73870.1 class A beta-lactamase-related serine hydrolase [Gemmatimonadaceae bacterium]